MFSITSEFPTSLCSVIDIVEPQRDVCFLHLSWRLNISRWVPGRKFYKDILSERYRNYRWSPKLESKDSLEQELANQSPWDRPGWVFYGYKLKMIFAFLNGWKREKIYEIRFQGP